MLECHGEWTPGLYKALLLDRYDYDASCSSCHEIRIQGILIHTTVDTDVVIVTIWVAQEIYEVVDLFLLAH